MDVQKFRAIHVKFEHGDRLSNSELTALIAYYDDLVRVLDRGFLPQFTLMQREAWSNQRRLHYIRDARVNG